MKAIRPGGKKCGEQLTGQSFPAMRETADLQLVFANATLRSKREWRRVRKAGEIALGWSAREEASKKKKNSGNPPPGLRALHLA